MGGREAGRQGHTADVGADNLDRHFDCSASVSTAQAAVRAQDREAIKILMNHRDHGATPPAAGLLSGPASTKDESAAAAGSAKPLIWCCDSHDPAHQNWIAKSQCCEWAGVTAVHNGQVHCRRLCPGPAARGTRQRWRWAAWACAGRGHRTVGGGGGVRSDDRPAKVAEGWRR